MKKEDLVNLGLDEKQVEEVFKIRGQEIEAHKSKLSELESDKLTLKQERDGALSKIEELKNNSIDVDDYNKLKESNEQFESKLEELKNNHSKEIEGIQFNYILDSEIKSAGAIKPEYVKTALNKDVLEFKDGKIEGLAEELERVKREDSFLFDSGGLGSYTTKSNGGGRKPSNPFQSKLAKYNR